MYVVATPSGEGLLVVTLGSSTGTRTHDWHEERLIDYSAPHANTTAHALLLQNSRSISKRGAGGPLEGARCNTAPRSGRRSMAAASVCSGASAVARLRSTSASSTSTHLLASTPLDSISEPVRRQVQSAAKGVEGLRRLALVQVRQRLPCCSVALKSEGLAVPFAEQTGTIV